MKFSILILKSKCNTGLFHFELMEDHCPLQNILMNFKQNFNV
jgi:hypothetical protein